MEVGVMECAKTIAVMEIWHCSIIGIYPILAIVSVDTLLAGANCTLNNVPAI